jgi:hypothetical protein
MTSRHFHFLAPPAVALILAADLARAADPTPAECIAASDAAIQLESQHKLHEERARLLECAAATCPADIRKDCLARVEEVNGQIPTLVFSAKDAAGADRSAVRVIMDGEVLAERLGGTAVTIDPGEHAFVFETAGETPVRETLLIVEGQKDRRETITFGSRERAPATASVAAAPIPPGDSGGLGTRRVLALVAGGIGVVGVGLGTAFGLSAVSKRSYAQSVCPQECGTRDGVIAWSDAVSTGNASTVAFAFGGLGLVAGAVLWLTAPSAPSVQVALGAGSLRVEGAW